MMNLYEINAAIAACVDSETGEIIDAAALDALQMEKAQKLENVACWYKDLIADADALKTEKEALASREKAKRDKAEQLKSWLADACGYQKFESPRAVVSFRKSEAVEVEDYDRFADWAVIHKMPELVTFKLPAPNKPAIKKLLKAGTPLDGCKIVENINISIK